MGRQGRRISSATATRASRPDWRRSSTGEWDAAIDMSGYVPRCVERIGARARRTRRALHVRLVALRVCGREPPGLDESTPVATLDDPASEDIMAHYGALKARCEDEVRAAFGRRALVVRPGLIVGPLDPTDRFAYWVARFVCPDSLGARTRGRGRSRRRRIAPSSSSMRATSRRGCSTWRSSGRKARSTRAVPRARGRSARSSMSSSRRRARRAARRCRGGSTTKRSLRHGVTPWTGLPLWIPASDPESAGFMDLRCARAAARGLAHPSARADGRRHGGVAARARDVRRVAQRAVRPTRSATILADVGAGAPHASGPVRS